MLHQTLKLGVLLVFLCYASSYLQAQDQAVAIGEWRSHLSYESSIAVTESENAVFFGTAQAVLKVNKSDQSLEHINKVSGLSDMGIKTLEYHTNEQLLIIAYLNGNIDLLHDNGYVQNLSALLTNNNILGDKSINHIYTKGKNIYFSCAFGLVVYDLELEAFSQTTFTPTAVNACSQYNNTLFIATDDGIYTGILDGRNLLDFTLWEKQGMAEGLDHNNYTSNNLALFNNKIYADFNDSLVVYHNGTWGHFSGVDKSNNTAITHWSPNPNIDGFHPFWNMSLSYDKNTLAIATNTYRYYTINDNDEVYTNNYSGSWRVQDLVFDQHNKSWAADSGYIHYDYTYIQPNAPFRTVVSDMYVDNNGVLWVSSSPYNAKSNEFNHNGFFRYQDGVWTQFNSKTVNNMDDFMDAIKIVHNPVTDKLYVGSFMSGLLEMDSDNNITTYDQYTPNCPLSRAEGDTLRTRVMGLAVDEDGVVWMTNSRTISSLLVAKKRNGDWKAFPSHKFNDFQVEELIIDRNGYKWIKQITGKVTVFDSGDIDDDNDDRSYQLQFDNSALPNNDVTTLVADKKGIVWVGTTAGVALFNCSQSIFEGDCDGDRPTVLQDDFRAYLLETEEIMDIAVDGGNRKWVATKNGLFLLSDDGKQQLAHFTKENSPLFNDEVEKLAIDGTTGTIYIATTNGIQSLRIEAITGLLRAKEENIEVFPHPVEPDYAGPIAISKLPDDANVKITDISGRLVYETTALGGQAIWEGTDYNGRKAQSGVYLVFIANETGSQKAVGKILFLN